MSKNFKEISLSQILTHQNSLTSILIGINNPSIKIKIDDR